MEQAVTAGCSANDDITKLHCKGTGADDNNEPTPKSTWSPPPQSQGHEGEIIFPTSMQGEKCALECN